MRVTPTEVHFNDPEVIETVYPTTGRKTDKPQWVADRTGSKYYSTHPILLPSAPYRCWALVSEPTHKSFSPDSPLFHCLNGGARCAPKAPQRTELVLFRGKHPAPGAHYTGTHRQNDVAPRGGGGCRRRRTASPRLQGLRQRRHHDVRARRLTRLPQHARLWSGLVRVDRLLFLPDSRLCRLPLVCTAGPVRAKLARRGFGTLFKIPPDATGGEFYYSLFPHWPRRCLRSSSS